MTTYTCDMCDKEIVYDWHSLKLRGPAQADWEADKWDLCEKCAGKLKAYLKTGENHGND